MIAETPSSSAARPERTDADAAYRDEFLKLLARLELKPAQAMALVEAGTSRPFETCTPAQLVPVLHELLELLRSYRSPVDVRRECRV